MASLRSAAATPPTQTAKKQIISPITVIVVFIFSSPRQCLPCPFNQRNSHETGERPVGVAEDKAAHEDFPVAAGHAVKFAVTKIGAADEWVSVN